MLLGSRPGRGWARRVREEKHGVSLAMPLHAAHQPREAGSAHLCARVTQFMAALMHSLRVSAASTQYNLNYTFHSDQEAPFLLSTPVSPW